MRLNWSFHTDAYGAGDFQRWAPMGKFRVLSLAICAVLIACSYSIESKLKAVSAANDPNSSALEEGYNSYVRRAFLVDHTEIGLISMKDGSWSKYWFRSHHHTGDSGGTLFRLSDGTEIFMAGYFCCEVQLPEGQLESLQALRTFVSQHDGWNP